MPNLRATVLLKCLFPVSGEEGPFSAAKKSVPLQFPWPQLYSLFFFSATHCCCWISFFLGGDEGVSSGGGGRGGCFFFQSLPGTGVELRIWFHARKIQALSCCWFGWSGVSLLIPTGLSKSFCSLSLSLCLSLHLSHSVLNLGFGVKPGRRSVAWGHDSSRCCRLRRPRRPRSPLNWSRWKCVGQTAVGIDSCVPSGETGLDAYHNTLMGLCSLRFLAGSPEESGTVQ